PGAFMTTCPGQGFCNTPFVAKIRPDGSLGYSTYTGGSNTSAAAIAVDLAGEASITGTTASNDLPIVNAFQPDYQGFVCTSCYNAFVQKLNAVGSALVYSTYFG